MLPRDCGFFEVSSGLEQVSQGAARKVDHGREACGVAVAAGAGSGGLEEAVEAFEAGIAGGIADQCAVGTRG